MLAVSRAASRDAPLDEVLDEIAAEATALTGACAASILELAGDRMRVIGNHGLGRDYRRQIDTHPAPVRPGRGPSGLAITTGAPVVTADALTDPRFPEYADLARGGGYRALATAPLMVRGKALGALTLYRRVPHEWSEEEQELLTFFAGHAATAVDTARLIAERQRQVAALERFVVRLREQAHEHANRIHAIAGLLVLGDVEEALRFVEDLTEIHHSDSELLARQPSGNALSGLLWVEMILARQRCIDLRLDVSCDLGRLPLTDAQALTIVGNLLDNAMDAAAAMSGERRRVEVRIWRRRDSVAIRVRDWGRGVVDADGLFASGYSTKQDHPGVGLSLVRDALHAACGQVEVERLDDGVAFLATIPDRGAEVAPLVPARLSLGRAG